MKYPKSLIITTGNFPFGGCTANLVREFARGMSENGIQTEVILLKGNEMDYRSGDQNHTGLPRYHHFLFRIQPVGFIMKLIQFLLIIGIFPFYFLIKLISGNFRIVYFYGIEYPYLTLPNLIICKLLRRKCIRIITDIYSKNSVASTWWRKPKWNLYKIEFKYIDRHFDGLVVLSDLLKEKLIQSHVRPEKIIKILHFIDFSEFINAKSQGIQKSKYHTIGYIGTISHANGVDVLLDAFELLARERNNIRLLIVGDLNYETGMSEKIESKIQTKNLDIIAPGFQAFDKIKSYYQDCDILINPRISGHSADAGFPTKVGEYMSTGKPVIVTAVGYFKNPQYLKETGVTVIEPDSPAEMANAIRKVLDNYEFYVTESLKNISWVRNNLDYYHNSKSVLDFIEDR
jgi:glycosyltransferase involved in cell wall biosynthesis